MSKTYAYLRISKDDQNIESQKYGLLQYANKHDLGQLEIIEDEKTSRAEWHNRENGKLLKETTQSQDVVLFPEVTRAARNPLELLEIMKVAAEKELKLIFIKENLTFNATGQSELEKLQVKHFIMILGMTGELAREFTRVRTQEGVERARAEGKQIGRQQGQDVVWKLDYYYDTILQQLKRGHSQIAIVRMLNEKPNVKVHRNTFKRWLERWNLKTLRSNPLPDEITRHQQDIDQARQKIKAYLAEHDKEISANAA